MRQLLNHHSSSKNVSKSLLNSGNGKVRRSAQISGGNGVITAFSLKTSQIEFSLPSGGLFPFPEFRRLFETFSELERWFRSCLINISRECSSQNMRLEPRKRSRADSLSEIAIFYRNSTEQKVSTSRRAWSDIPGNYCSLRQFRRLRRRKFLG